jgi:UDP-N-acetylglucosamine 2-epimerase (non-hydrolysing)
MAKKILFVFGTRPEAIKMAPLILHFRKFPERWSVKVCVTAQHREMLDQVLAFFEIIPDYDLNLMKSNQTLAGLTARILEFLDPVLVDAQPDLVLVQGDTTTAFTAALSAYYRQIPVGHIEAGLRSGNKLSPFPEEINRIMAGHISAIHFAPTSAAARNLQNEGIHQQVFITGNTVIDALIQGLDKIKQRGEEVFQQHFGPVRPGEKIILVTGHRRESFGKPFEEICQALLRFALKYPDSRIIYPVHLNPHVQEPVYRILGSAPNIQLMESLSYPQLIYLLSRCFFVLTDSGGIQEEAPALGKPVLVMRQVTERKEGIDAGTARLVGTEAEDIYQAACELMDNAALYDQMAKAVNPYGDGTASRQIEQHLSNFFSLTN